MVRGLFCFDMEGTLLQGEILDIIADRKGVGKKVREITRKAMEGQLDFESALSERLHLLAGAKVKEFEAVVENVPLMPHAKELISLLRGMGHYTVLVTGGFDKAAKVIAEKLGVDSFVAHALEVKDDILTGNYKLSYLDKALVLKEFADRVKPDFTVAVGDGANDLSMLKAADIGILLNPGEGLKQNEELLHARNLQELLHLFSQNERSILIDKSLSPLASKLFNAIGTVTVNNVNNLNNSAPTHANIVLIRTRTKVNSAFIGKIEGLEIIATATTGTDHIDLTYAKECNITVFDAKGANSDSVADYVIRTLLYATDDVLYTVPLLKQTHDFERIKSHNKRHELRGTSLGIVGLGRIGSRVKKRAEALGVIVKAYDPYKKGAQHTLKEALECDFVTLHPELTDETRGMMGGKEFSLMKPHTILINTSRGEVVDEQALIEALKKSKISMAILDVYQNEPNYTGLYDLPNVICTPHIAGNSQEAKERAAKQLFLKVAENYMETLQNE